MVNTVIVATVLLCLAVAKTTALPKVFHIVPNNNSSISANLQVDCHVQQCYTLESVVKHPDQFFASNRVLTLLPGYHSVTGNFGNTLIADVDNLTVNGTQHSMIECTGTFGLTFLNVSNVQLLNFHISHCGAPVVPEVRQKLNKFVSYFSFDNLLFYDLTSIALQIVHSYNIGISGITVNCSTEAGLVAVNIFEKFIISQATFTQNKVNCLIMSVISLQVPLSLVQYHYISNSSFTFGNTTNLRNDWVPVKLAGGLNIVYAQETFQVNVSMTNVTTHSNKAKRGNLMLRFERCSHQVTFVQIEQLKSSTQASMCEYGLYLTAGELLGDSKCNKLRMNPLVVQNSFFTKSCMFIKSNSPIIAIILEGITIQESSCTAAAIHAVGIHSLELRNARVIKNFDVIHVVNTNVTIYGQSIFSENRGEIYFGYSNALFSSKTSFTNNRPESGVVMAYQSIVTFKGSAFFGNNTAGMCGGMYAYKSTIHMRGDLMFMGNEGYNGGAMALYDSVLDLTATSFSKIEFVQNTAHHSGGAIYIDDAGKAERFARILLCSFQILAGVPRYYRMEFVNNSASFAGSALYGGWIDICRIHKDKHWSYGTSRFYIHGSPKDLSVVSSNPCRVCICNDSLPNCNVTALNITVYPGQTFRIQAVAVGQRFGTVPSIVQAEISSADGNTSAIGELEYFQGVHRVCSDLRYTVMSANSREIILLKVDKSIIPSSKSLRLLPDRLQFSQLYINVTLNPCSLGFMFSTELNICICHKTLLKHKIDCNINSQRVNRTAQKWINATFAHTTGRHPGILVHNHCPFDYCKPEAIFLDLEDPDKQCAFNRSGVLCGACQPQLSQVFGTSNCRECSSLWLLVLVPSIALAGVALLVAVILLNLTVSIGTINGLIFYANIVRAINTTYFPTETINSFLDRLIAWINLDLGIDACFYNGLDAYTKTWLQFIFPLYIWIMVIIIIVSSHYSTIAAKLSGRNAVQVLATLFLLSYSKMLRITITSFSSTVLVYPDNSLRRVWLYDGNVDYLKGKHIPLFIAALLLLLFISLPYTTILISIQQLQLCSKYRALFWVHKLKPLFDAYTGPYKEKHRYWTGLLLLVRVELFLVFSMNALGDPAINLLTVSVTITSLLTYLTFLGGIYKRVMLDAIEFSFYLNLGVLSVATLYTRHTDGDQTKVVHLSVSIAFISFLIIIFCHAFIKILPTPQQKKIDTKFQELRVSFKSCWSRLGCKQTQTKRPQVTNTSVELREPLLED